MVRCYQFVRLAITYYAQTLFQLIVSFVKSNLRVNDGKGWLDQGLFLARIENAVHLTMKSKPDSKFILSK